MQEYDYLIVGVGLSGIVMAERLSQDGKKVLMIDSRSHIGGNCYDYVDAAGVLVHKYGPHYFRTNSQEVIRYLSNFTAWTPHRYKVRARIGNMLYSFPLNRKTFEQFFKKTFRSAAELRDFVDSVRCKEITQPKNAKEQVLSKVGNELYDAFFKDYTLKQWGVDASNLDPSVTSRIPIREDDNDDYLAEDFQAIPLEGYTKMFEKMLASPLIEVRLNTPYCPQYCSWAKKIIWTGPIDQYYNYRFGKLPYRSLQFIFVSLYDLEYAQECEQINFPTMEVPYTRIVEIKHVTHQKCNNTTLSIEIPQSEGTPYYPVPNSDSRDRYNQYYQESLKDPKVYFLGRLGTYRYLNMDQCVAEALKLYQKLHHENK